MRGYPKGLKNVQDYENLLSMPEHRAQALADLTRIAELDDDEVGRDDTPADAPPDAERVITRIPNPMPAYKLAGFVSREAVRELTERYA